MIEQILGRCFLPGAFLTIRSGRDRSPRPILEHTPWWAPPSPFFSPNYLVKEKGIDPASIIIFGRSLGSAVAAELAMKRKAGALIIESGFTSIPDLGRKYYPYLPVSLITRFHYATIDKVSSLALPKLFIHSPEGETIPYDQGMRLFERAAEPKEFLKLRGDHNEGFLLSGELYINGLQQFISRYF